MQSFLFVAPELSLSGQHEESLLLLQMRLVYQQQEAVFMLINQSRVL